MAGRPTATRWPGARLKKAWPSCPARHFFAPTPTKPRCACRSPPGASSRFAQAGPAWRRGAGPVGPREYLPSAAVRAPSGSRAAPTGLPSCERAASVEATRASATRRRIARAQLAQFLRNPDLQTALDRQVETRLGHVLGQIALARSKAILLIVRVAIVPASP